MDKFLEIIGMLVIGLTLLAMAIVLSAATSDTIHLIVGATLAWGVPSIVGGAILAAFGAMLGHLKAIHKLIDRQVRLAESASSERLAAEPVQRTYSVPGVEKPSFANLQLRNKDI